MEDDQAQPLLTEEEIWAHIHKRVKETTKPEVLAAVISVFQRLKDEADARDSYVK